MKKNILYCLISAAAMFFAGCTFDERLTSSDRIVEGVPTTVNINFGIDGGQVYTRAEENPSVNESRVSNLYVMVFDSDGNRVSTTNNDGVETAFFYEPQGGLIVNPGSSVTGSVSFNVPSMTGATVVAVANISEGGVTTVYTLSKATLDDITTLQGFKDLVVPAMESVIRGNNMLMSAMAENVTIYGPEQDATMDCDLVLRRIDAKIKVVLTSSPSNSAWTDFSFQPKTWRVRRVPGQSRLVPFDNPAAKAGPWVEIGTGNASEWDAAGKYYDTGEYEFEDVESEDRDNTLYYKGGSFSFYMPENREVAKKSVSGGYALREKRAADGTFEYANDNSTYLEITGYISYKDAGQVVNAEVTFYVHLGYAKSDTNPTPNADDYDTRQNGSYTYNITVTGVDNIIVEVDEGTEVRPGYEGDVVISSNVIEVDAHYETHTLNIPLDSPFETMTWGVRTPFSSGIYSGIGEPGPGVKDYQWIKFAINRHFNVPHESYVAFPGIDRYEPDRDWTMEDIDAAAAIPEKRPLLDIDQLLKYLKAKYEAGEINSFIASGTSEHICITAFVDEYLYTSDPEGNVTSSTPELFWKKCVDTDDRQLHILTPSGDMYSEDKNSSKVSSRHTFTQRSIRTIYNKDADDGVLSTAWGIETNSGWGEEGGERLEPGDVRLGSSTRDGRANSLKWMTGSWNTYVDFTTNSLRGNYNSAAYACLMRNRDENGNGTIDNFEVKWYLAAIDQLTDIYIGEWALNEASRLYPQNPANRPGGKNPYWHYTSSSADGSNPWVLWAEEGASRGTYSGNPGSVEQNGPYYSYRCLRNLGVKDDAENYVIQDIVIVNGPDEVGNYEVDLSRMNPKSLRESPTQMVNLPEHNERDPDGWNLPYAAFSVDRRTLPSPEYYIDDDHWVIAGTSSYENIKITWPTALDWMTYQTYTCPEGYRVPNQRELLIMSTRLPEAAWPSWHVTVGWYEWPLGDWSASHKTEQRDIYVPNYMCATKFSMNGINGYTDQRQGFMWNPEKKVFLLRNNDSERGYVRCVKDTN